MLDFLLFIFLVTLFKGYGLLLFLLYLAVKRHWPQIQDFFERKGYAKIIDLSSHTFNPKTKPASKPSTLFPTHPMSLLTPSRLVKLLGLIILIVLFLDGFTSIPAGHVGVIYDRGRGVLTSYFPEGLHLKIPFWQVIEKMDTRLQTMTMSIDPNEGKMESNYFGDDSIESLTKDGQKVIVDTTIQYRLTGENAPWVFQNIGLDYAQKVIRPGVRNVARDIVTGYDSTQLFTQETRLEAQKKMEEALRGLYAKNHIEMEDVLLRNIKFSDVYLQAIEDKQVAQQRIQKAEYERQEAEKTKEKKIIEAEAEAQAIKLKGETLRANPQVIQFEFVQKMSDKIEWGILPNDILPLLDLKRFNQQ